MTLPMSILLIAGKNCERSQKEYQATSYSKAIMSAEHSCPGLDDPVANAECCDTGCCPAFAFDQVSLCL